MYEKKFFSSLDVRLYQPLVPRPQDNWISPITDVGVILIGHGAPWEERSQLIAHFKQVLPATLVIASLRRTDKPFSNADFNCPAGNPPEWFRLITQAIAGIE